MNQARFHVLGGKLRFRTIQYWYQLMKNCTNNHNYTKWCIATIGTEWVRLHCIRTRGSVIRLFTQFANRSLRNKGLTTDHSCLLQRDTKPEPNGGSRLVYGKSFVHSSSLVIIGLGPIEQFPDTTRSPTWNKYAITCTQYDWWVITMPQGPVPKMNMKILIAARWPGCLDASIIYFGANELKW